MQFSGTMTLKALYKNYKINSKADFENQGFFKLRVAGLLTDAALTDGHFDRRQF
jgi:hypothetical protein